MIVAVDPTRNNSNASTNVMSESFRQTSYPFPYAYPACLSIPHIYIHLPITNSFSSFMGNYISCTLSTSPGNHPKGPKVILPDGTIRRLDQPTNAAELMLDSPGNFLVNSCSMQLSRRFSPLTADEELEMGNLYVMLPMLRLNSLVTAADLARLLMVADKAVRRASGGSSRILPPVEPRLKLDETEDEFSHRWSMCRSRRPMLETIVEEVVCSR